MGARKKKSRYGQKRRPLIDRFMEKVQPEPNTGCWLWLGACMPGGNRGHIKEGAPSRRVIAASRASWLLFNGQPGGAFVLHKCDNQNCVNPDHLFLGTQMENMRDMASKGRGGGGTRGCKTRERIGVKEAVEIRNMHSAGLKKRTLSRIFSISRKTVWRIVNNKTRVE